MRPNDLESLSTTYRGLWNKYKPAILKMMVDANEEIQSYQLSSHEFQAFNSQKRGPYSFTLQVAHGKVLSGMKDSVVAQGLWEILQLSRKASELISTSSYQFWMDKTFILRIQKEN